MYNSTCYLIHCHTNLHAGSGDTTYGIIDKMVQRDVVTKLPCIYASSLKGALREFFEEGPDKVQLSGDADTIFGKKINSENESVDNSKGNTIFHEAQLIGFPMRSNQKPYFIATSKAALKSFMYKAGLFNIKLTRLEQEINDLPEVSEGAPVTLNNAFSELMIEDFEEVRKQDALTGELSKYLGTDLLLMHENDFTAACSDYNLPVIARNNLENGESKNLWYEQIVPHQSRFVFFTVCLGKDQFSQSINGKTVQIGANSSLGYGYCKISKMQTA